MSDDEHLVFNGINGANGEYSLPEMTSEQLIAIARGVPPDKQAESEIAQIRGGNKKLHLGLVDETDEKELSKAGWGIVFGVEDSDRAQSIKVDAIREALAPLLALRRSQVGNLYKEYTDKAAPHPADGNSNKLEESRNRWLARHGVAAGRVNPDKVPYYLLLVGSPQAISYQFQYQLGVQFAVGRIHFDSLAEYDNYARSVVAAETGGLALPRRAVFFGVQNKFDAATSLSARGLVEPLAGSIAAKYGDWDVETVLKTQATKARLTQLLGGDDTPALLFTASHGVEFPKDDLRQLPHQGALLCQDWPGPLRWPKGKAIPEEHYFSGDDVAGDSRLHGLMSFHFACYGAGTPEYNSFAKKAGERNMIAPHPFIARLPQRLISHPSGGALAVVGHVERAWGFSIKWGRAGVQTAVFEHTLERLMDGYPVGSALKYFPERYADIATMLNPMFEDLKFDLPVDEREFAELWTANNDARSYVIIGDPAVKLPIAVTGTPANDGVG